MPETVDEKAALEALLDFYVEAGVDQALDETPHDRFRKEPGDEAKPVQGISKSDDLFVEDRPASSVSASSRPSLPRAAAKAPDDVTELARQRALSALSLEELEAALRDFEGCALKFSAKNLVFHDGNPKAQVMFVGEAPGADEDRIGKPFMGRSGQLLDRMLAAIGLDRSQVYIANVVPWRPPGNRTPTPQEISICRPFISRQIELVAPQLLVCLGGPATQTLLGIKDGILRTRGRWFSYKSEKLGDIRTLATLHPAYLLRQPLQKRLSWQDFLTLRRALDQKV